MIRTFLANNSLAAKHAFLGFLLSILVFGRTIGFPFYIFDDASHITDNPLVWSLSIDNLVAIWTGTAIPVTLSLWAFLCSISNLQPAIFHLVNVILHCINSVLVFLLLKEFLSVLLPEKERKEIQISAFLGSLIFSFHPIQVEAVAWISGLKDLLSSFFVLLALYLVFFRNRNSTPRTYGIYVFAIWVSVILGALSKPSALIGFVLIPWIEVSLLKRRFSDLTKDYWPAIPLIIFVGLRFILKDGNSNQPTINLPLRLILVLDSYAFYFAHTFLPTSFFFNYGKAPLYVVDYFLKHLTFSIINTCCASLAIASIYYAGILPKFRPLHFALGFFVISLLPYSGIFPFSHQNISTVADRYTYLSIFGVSLLGAWLWLSAKEAFGQMRGIILLAFGILLFQSLIQVNYWKTSTAILDYSARMNPANYLTRAALAHSYLADGNGVAAFDEIAIVQDLVRAESEISQSYTYPNLPGPRVEIVQNPQYSIPAVPSPTPSNVLTPLGK